MHYLQDKINTLSGPPRITAVHNRLRYKAPTTPSQRYQAAFSPKRAYYQAAGAKEFDLSSQTTIYHFGLTIATPKPETRSAYSYHQYEHDAFPMLSPPADLTPIMHLRLLDKHHLSLQISSYNRPKLLIHDIYRFSINR